MEPNGILPVQGLILNLLQSAQQDQVPSQIGGNGQATVPSGEEAIIQATNPSSNTPVPELPITKILPIILADGIQGMDAQALTTMFQKLGMDYEKRLWKALNLTASLQSQEFQEIKDTLKAHLIAAAKKDPEAKLWLDTLTNLQMKQASDHDSQVYLVMDLPYRLQEKAYQARIAVHGNKKGKEIDMEHCRIGLNIVTDTLGEIGIDAMFYDHALTVTLMTEMPEVVSTLWDQLKDSVVEDFAGQGYQLIGVRVSPLGDERFDSFIHGIEPKGVDIKV